MIRPDESNSLFYGWYIVGVAFIANFMTAGSGFYLFNAFMQPLVDERGWTYTQVSNALVIGPAVGLLCQLIYGWMIYKTGPRVIMSLGPILAGAAFIMLGRVGDIWMFYFFFVLLGFGNGAMSGIASGTAVNNWFIKKRGLAIGIATGGISLSGAILPFLALLILEQTSLTQAYLMIGIAILVTAPVSWFVIKDWPEKYGMVPDGIYKQEESSPPDTDSQNGSQEPALSVWSFGGDDVRAPRWTLSMLVRTGAFWRIGCSFTLVLIGISGVMAQLKPRFSNLGFDDRTAMALMGATALLGTLGKFFWGIQCDRYGPKKVAMVIMAGGGLGLSFGLLENSFIALPLFVVTYGFCMGGILATMPVMIATFFGRYSFASVAKFLALFLLFQGIGPIAMGQSIDRTGSYDSAFILFVILNFAAAILISSAKKPRMPEL